jgi:tetratricopeptide (TPR) repeat protein
MCRLPLWLMLAVCATATPARGDVVYLADGRRIEGSIERIEGGWKITATDGSVLTVSPSQVARVEIGGAAPSTRPARSASPSDATAASAADKLASLRRAVEPLSDINQIIARYERFIASNPNTPAAEEARGEIAAWRTRQAQNMVKVGSRWVTLAEREELYSRIGEMVSQAVSLVRDNQSRDAEVIVARILELDPKNISALYLQGLTFHGQEQIVPAKKAFEGVNSQIADHAPTLNNLAVIAFRQNQFGLALNYYDQAMAAAPLDRTIIDNFAEAVHALDENGRKLPILRRVQRRFAEQEKALAAQLARQNLYRWGATWVNKEQLDQLQAEQQRIDSRIRELSQTRDQRQRDVMLIEDQVASIDRALRQMEADRYTYSVEGRLLVMPLPSAYYQMQRERDVLIGERQRVVASVQAVEREIQATRQDLPVPLYSGVQKLIGAEGTPIEQLPATQPSERELKD